MKILITGAAGFIGYHLVERYLSKDIEIVGLDNINDYYSIDLKFARLKQLGIQKDKVTWNNKIFSEKYSNLSFIRMNLQDREQIEQLFEKEKFTVVCNLAAQAGVRYSIQNPQAYIDSNIVGFANILEGCRYNNVKHLIYASSSSVYGDSVKMPLSTEDSVDNPISLYAATKKSNELMAYTYSHLYNIPTTGLRFFTVYGPWGRPDMAYFLFANAIKHNETIKVFNHGNLYRDFTYIDDIIDGVEKIIDKIPVKKPPYKIYNIGNSSPIKLMDFIETIEKEMGEQVKKEFVEMQPGDVTKTYADVSGLQNDFKYSPSTSLEDGIKQFIKWYNKFYQ